MDRPERGPVRARPRRARPPKRRSSVGPLVFLLLVMALVFGFLFAVRPAMVDAAIDFISERDSLMRQPVLRALVAPRVQADTDVALDPNGQLRSFEVRRGETASEIGRDLQEQRFVRSGFAFVYLLYDTDREDALQSGTYRISAAMTPREIAKAFERAPGEQTVLKIIEGWRLSEIAAAVSKAFPNIPKEAFAASAVVGDRKNTVLAGLDPKTPLEGYLFPDTYFFRPDATAGQIVDTLLDTFELRAAATLRASSVARKTTIYDIVTLASIVEREARDRTEGPVIAGVYANRLRLGMKLDADPTVQYALGDWRALSADDLKTDSPYNTYRVAGLPPTPISNPGQRALEAAAAPASHDFLFFVAKEDGTGEHLFARTLEEQEANRAKVGNR